ncbi:MAG: hypothetical protein JJ992_08820, partial [Planctomycetes bacterium]|nr:hypothetical protein [Planctomycetota bacterium]
TAIGNLQGRLPSDQLRSALLPLLSDPVRLVRTEAARVLSTVPIDSLSPDKREEFQQALDDFHRGLMTANDRAASHMTWGIVQESLGNDQQAIQSYETAIRVEPHFAGPRTNLAAVYDRLAEGADARARQAALLRDPSAGRRAAEEAGRCREEAQELRREELACLERDARLVPDNAAIQYRYGMLLYLHRRLPEAEQALLRASRLEPNNPQFLLGIVLFYQEVKEFKKALPLAEELAKLRPADPVYRQVLADIQQQAAAGGREKDS